MGRRAKGQQQKRKGAAVNNPDQESSGWLEQRGFGGLDWASQKHSVVVVESNGQVIEDFEIEHSTLGWKKFREQMKPYGWPGLCLGSSQNTVRFLWSPPTPIYLVP
jgi:hypothetical protein